MIKFTPRQWTLGLALVATLAAVVWVGGGEPGDNAVSAPVSHPGRPPVAAATPAPAPQPGVPGTGSAQAPAQGTVDPARLLRAVELRNVHDPFATSNVQAPPPPVRPAITVAAAAPPPPPPPPSAPPFPWTFMGRLIEDPRNPAMFLSRGDRLTVAHIGDTLDNAWKVNGMDARGLRVEYLPLKLSQSVSLASGGEIAGGATASAAALNQASSAAGPLLLQQLQQQQQLNAAGQNAPGGVAPNVTSNSVDGELRNEAPAPVAPAAVNGIELSNSFGARP